MRCISWLLICCMTTLVQVEVFAAKPAPPPPASPGAACISSTWAFPAMAYSRGVYSKSGAYQKTQIFVADSGGTCEVMVYDTGDYAGYPVNVSFHFDVLSGWGTLVWQQLVDNGKLPAPGRVVKLARFQVVSRAVVGLPISASTIYKLPATLKSAIDDVELSQDGTRVAFTENYKVTDAGPWTLQVKICDLPGCQNIETAFTVSENSTGGLHQLTIGRNATNQERVYFLYRPNGAAHVGDLVAVDNLGGQLWTPPFVVINRDTQYMTSIGDTDTWLDTPSALSTSGYPDRVLISSRDGFGGTPRIDVYDAATVTLTRNVGQGFRPTWTTNPSNGDGPNVLVTERIYSSTSPVHEVDPVGRTDTPLAVQGYAADSAN